MVHNIGHGGHIPPEGIHWEPIASNHEDLHCTLLDEQAEAPKQMNASYSYDLENLCDKNIQANA